MFTFLRLTTLHPAFAHLPLGAIPLCMIAYGMATLRNSERWLFAGDVALVFAALSALVVVAFGYLSYFLLHWPGGLGPWPIVHMVLGSATALYAVWFAVLRIRTVRRIRRTAGATQGKAIAVRTSLGALCLLGLVLVTGYIGGEILAYHGGMAVQSGGSGALAPPLSVDNSSPESLLGAMQRLRPLWAMNVDLMAKGIVVHPKPEDLQRIANNAGRIAKLARWLMDWGTKPQSAQHHDPATIHRYANDLQGAAQRLQAAANAGRLADVADALGAMSSTCAQCHAAER